MFTFQLFIFHLLKYTFLKAFHSLPLCETIWAKCLGLLKVVHSQNLNRKCIHNSRIKWKNNPVDSNNKSEKLRVIRYKAKADNFCNMKLPVSVVLVLVSSIANGELIIFSCNENVFCLCYSFRSFFSLFFSVYVCDRSFEFNKNV